MASMNLNGTVEPGFEQVRVVFEEQVAASLGTGAGFAVWHEGRWVVDLWGGFADAGRSRPWVEDTIVMPYSVTKPFAAVCVLMLVDRGLVDLDAPMTTYWSGLRGGATLRQVLAHTAGHVVLEEPAAEEAFYDWDLMCAALERQQPSWPPGTAIGESALLYGHLLGQVVRAVDGRSLGRFLRDEVCRPHGLDFRIGVPSTELTRVADLTGFDDRFAAALAARGGLMSAALANPPGALDPTVVNSTRWRQAEIPAVNGHGTARAVAGLHLALAQGRVLSERTLAEMVAVQSDGQDLVVGSVTQWGLGVGVDPSDGWGMGGVGGSFGWWSSVGEYAAGFVTGVIADHDPGTPLENAVRRALGLAPV